MQPQAHLGDHAEVRLHEGLVPGGSEAMTRGGPDGAAFHRAHAGAQQLAIGQHHFKSADVLAVVAAEAEAAFQRVAHHAAPAIAGNAHFHRDLVAREVFVQLEEADSGFDDAVAELLVDFQDAVHPAQVQHHRARHARRGAAIAQVLAAGNRPQRQLVFIGHAQHGLKLLDAGRRDGGRRRVSIARTDGIGIEVGVAVLVGGEHPLRTHDLAQVGQRAVESRAGHARRQYQSHDPP